MILEFRFSIESDGAGELSIFEFRFSIGASEIEDEDDPPSLRLWGTGEED